MKFKQMIDKVENSVLRWYFTLKLNLTLQYLFKVKKITLDDLHTHLIFNGFTVSTEQVKSGIKKTYCKPEWNCKISFIVTEKEVKKPFRLFS